MTELQEFQPLREVIIVGDAHGCITNLNFVAKKNPKILHIQIGDLGIGFLKEVQLCNNVKFFRGNHDNPAECKLHPSYLGDFGTIQGVRHKLFYIAGGWSIDWEMRIPGHSWWADEELSYEVLWKLIDRVVKEKPQIILSHEAPASLISLIGDLTFGVHPPSRTATALQHIFELAPPELWIFGHYHKSWSWKKNDTMFRCLNELETFPLSL